MVALDTNIIVRYLVADDQKQFQSVKDLIENSGPDTTNFVPLSVAVELERVLRSLYDQSKETMLELFSRLPESRELQFQEEASIEFALSLYSDNNTDFADCLHVAAAFLHDHAPLMTFDRKASGLMDGQLQEYCLPKAQAFLHGIRDRPKWCLLSGFCHVINHTINFILINWVQYAKQSHCRSKSPSVLTKRPSEQTHPSQR